MKTIEIDDTTLERFDNMISAYEADTGNTTTHNKMFSALLGEFKY